MAIDKKFQGLRVSVHGQGRCLFRGEIRQLPPALMYRQPIGKIIIYEAEGIPSVELSRQEFLQLVGEPAPRQ